MVTAKEISTGAANSTFTLQEGTEGFSQPKRCFSPDWHLVSSAAPIGSFELLLDGREKSDYTHSF